MKHLIYGNGESRKFLPLSPYIVTWGCNAIYRDFVVDNLVSVDYNMQQEIYESGYVKDNKCHFADWDILPPEFGPESLIMGWGDGNVHQTKEMPEQRGCVVQGKTKESVKETVKEIMALNPHMDETDLYNKLSYNVGLYITHVGEDRVENIEYPKGWSTGNTAIHLACQQGATEIYMVGFDGSDYSKPINNMYKGTKNYVSESAKGFNPINWNNQYNTIVKEFPNVMFYKISNKDETLGVNQKTMTYETYEKGV